MTDKNFAQLYCEKHGLKAEEYVTVVLKRGLYPHARLLAPLLNLFRPGHFAADLDFVRSVGQLRRFREFFNEAEEFAHHPANRGFWRLTANVRVSSRALRRMVRVTLHPDLEDHSDPGRDHTAVPFQDQGEEKHSERTKQSNKASV